MKMITIKIIASEISLKSLQLHTENVTVTRSTDGKQHEAAGGLQEPAERADERTVTAG